MQSAVIFDKALEVIKDDNDKRLNDMILKDARLINLRDNAGMRFYYIRTR